MDQQLRPRTRVEEKQEHLANMVRMICRSQYHALLCTGHGGGGKSRVVTNVVRDEGQEMELFNSHCTPLQLYRLLYRHAQDSERIIVFDDCDELYRSGPALGILRSALFGQPDRIVTYNSSSLPSDLPPRFLTLSKFIFLANKVPTKCPIFDSVASRCLTYRMDLSSPEIIQQFRVMSENGYPGCPPEAAAEIVDFIEQNGCDRQLSMRLLTPAIRIYKFCTEQGTDWRPVVLAQLQNLGRPTSATKRLSNQAKDARVLQAAQEKFPDSVQQQQEFFTSKTGKSRATFFRVLSRQRAEEGN